MRLFKKKEEKKAAKPKLNNVAAIRHHTARIENLQGEYDTKSHDLRLMELDEETPMSKKAKAMDILFVRMSHIKYEIGIRKEHLDGFDHKLD